MFASQELYILHFRISEKNQHVNKSVLKRLIGECMDQINIVKSHTSF